MSSYQSNGSTGSYDKGNISQGSTTAYGRAMRGWLGEMRSLYSGHDNLFQSFESATYNLAPRALEKYANDIRTYLTNLHKPEPTEERLHYYVPHVVNGSFKYYDLADCLINPGFYRNKMVMSAMPGGLYSFIGTGFQIEKFGGRGNLSTLLQNNTLDPGIAIGK